jgi:hypothetical protein
MVTRLIEAWLRHVANVLRGAPPPRPTLDDDRAMLESFDGLDTVYLSLDERAALDRLVAAGQARRERALAFGTSVFHRFHLLPPAGGDR